MHLHKGQVLWLESQSAKYRCTSAHGVVIFDRPLRLHKAEDFSTFTASGDVLLDVCTADSPAQLMLDRISKKVSVLHVHAYCNPYEKVICFSTCKQMMCSWAHAVISTMFVFKDAPSNPFMIPPPVINKPCGMFQIEFGFFHHLPSLFLPLSPNSKYACACLYWIYESIK